MSGLAITKPRGRQRRSLILGEKESNLRALCTILFVGLSFVLPYSVAAADLEKSETHQKNEETALPLSVHYRYSSDTTYEDIEIKDSVLKFTSLSKTSQQRIQKEAARSAESKRFWTEADLATKKAALSRRQIEAWFELIRESGFMRLEDSYGGNDPGGRHYPETISIQLGEAKKEVTYKHFPDAAPEPEAFAAVRRKLFSIVHEKLGASEE